MDTAQCRCGHERAAHEHYRAGTDCSLCECPRYLESHNGATSPLGRLVSLLRRVGR